ncbi:MAG: hypothetical protein Q8Q05_01325 [bacterium]|nr:hypothetical protein [bacterium]
MNDDTHGGAGQDWNPAVAQDPGESVFPPVFGGIIGLPENVAKKCVENERENRAYTTKEVLARFATIACIVALAAFCALSSRGCTAGYG